MITRSGKRSGWLEIRTDSQGQEVFVLRWWERDEKAKTGWRKRSRRLPKGTTRREAEQELASRGDDEETPDDEEQKTDRGGLSVSTFVEGPWLDYLEQWKVRDSTRNSYDSMLKNHVLSVLGDKSLPEIGPLDISGLFRSYRRKRLAVKYQRNLYGLLKLVFDVAFQNDLIGVSPVREKLHRPADESDEEGKVALTAEQIREVIAQADTCWQALLWTVALTGLRLGEAMGLKWEDIDWSNRSLHVRRSLWRGREVEPKTRASKRPLFLPKDLLEVLKEHQAASRWSDPEDWVFCREDGCPPDPGFLRNNVLYPAMDRAGIQRQPRKHGFHIFRHSAATLIEKKTARPTLAQRQLRHAQVSTTTKTYIHADDEDARLAAEALAEALRPGSCPPFAHPDESESGWIN